MRSWSDEFQRVNIHEIIDRRKGQFSGVNGVFFLEWMDITVLGNFARRRVVERWCSEVFLSGKVLTSWTQRRQVCWVRV